MIMFRDIFNLSLNCFRRFKMEFELTTFLVLRPPVVDLSFIVTCAHQKIKAFYCISFDYTKNALFVKNALFFFLFSVLLSIKKRKEKYTLNPIKLQNLL